MSQERGQPGEAHRCGVRGRPLAAGDVLFCRDPDGLCRAAWQETHRVRFSGPAPNEAPAPTRTAGTADGPAGDPYWTSDDQIGEVQLWNEPWTLRLAAHTAEEAYRRGQAEVATLVAARGSRTYVHARPYILVPEITLGLRLSPQPGPAGADGEVTSSTWEGMRREYLGSAQAWAYPSAHLILLWEVLLEDRYQTGPAATDPALRLVWDGVERFLAARFPTAARFVTPAADPAYADADYQHFLGERGYGRLGPATFAKVIPR